MKKFFWLILFACLLGSSAYLVYSITSNKFLKPDWWKTATLEQVQKKIQDGADINAKDKDGETVLMYAVRYNENPKIVKALLAAGADLHAKNLRGITVLMAATGFNKNPEIIKTLIAAGADVNAKDKNGYTALSYSNPEVLKILLAAGAKVTANDKDFIIGRACFLRKNAAGELWGRFSCGAGGEDDNIRCGAHTRYAPTMPICTMRR